MEHMQIKQAGRGLVGSYYSCDFISVVQLRKWCRIDSRKLIYSPSLKSLQRVTEEWMS